MNRLVDCIAITIIGIILLYYGFATANENPFNMLCACGGFLTAFGGINMINLVLK
jgi:hypothetical protein